MKGSLCVSLVFLCSLGLSCNFWDNLFSNLDGPNLDLPNDFVLDIPFISTPDIEYDIHFFFAGSLNKIMIKDMLLINGTENSNMKVVADFHGGYVYTETGDNCSEFVMGDLAKGININHSTLLWNLMTFFLEETEDGLFKFDLSCLLQSLLMPGQDQNVKLLAYIRKNGKKSNSLEKVELTALDQSIEAELSQSIQESQFDPVDFAMDKSKCLNKITAEELLESMVYPFAQSYYYDIIEAIKDYLSQYSPELTGYD